MIKTGIFPSQIVFLDIETVPESMDLEKYDPVLQAAWQKKELDFSQKAGVYAEFSRIACISVGYLNKETKEFRLKTYMDTAEEAMLNNFLARS